MAPAELIDRAIEALASRDWDGALAPLLQAYRSLGYAEIADAIRQVDAVARASGDVARGKMNHAAWMKRAAARRPSEIGLLGDDVLARRRDFTVERLRALIPSAPDPRISDAVIALVQAQPFTNKPRVVWETLRDDLPRLDDPALAARLRRCDRTWTTTNYLFRRALRELEAKHPDGPPQLGDSPSPHQEAVARLQAAIDPLLAPNTARQRELATLYAAVYEQPGADEPRLVLGDFLQQIGDPRGELIALQMLDPDSPASVARQNELLRAHGRKWLAPFRRALSQVQFRRGFPHAARLRLPSPEVLDGDAGYRDMPAWSTLEELDLRDGRRILPAMRSLRKIERANDEVVLQLCEGDGAWPIQHLGWSWVSAHETLERLGRASLPALRTLSITWLAQADEAPRWASRAPLALQLTRFEVMGELLIDRPAVRVAPNVTLEPA